MKKKNSIFWCTAVLVVVAAACGKEVPLSPTTTSPTTSNTASVGTLSVSLTIPQPVTPTDSQEFRFADQPLKLTVRNAVSTGGAALSYTFQVAADAAFTNLVYAKDGVAPAAGDRTSLTIDKIAGAKSYFWRARAVSGDEPGPFAKARGFSVGPEVVLQTPMTASPAQNGSLSGTPVLTVNNVGRSGPAGPVSYTFDLADSSAFSRIVFTATVAEQSGSTTSVTVNTPLPAGTYFWRVQASDPANAVTTPSSAVASFSYTPFDMRQAGIYNSPSDLGSWPESAKITSVVFTGNAMLVDFTKRNGPDRWPEEAFGSGGIQYTLGMCLNINARWNCSAVVQFWFGRELEASGRWQDVSFEWFYDGARWGPMAHYQPRSGETVGFFVGAGNLRGRTDPGYVTCPRVCERSNVEFVQWP